MAAEWSPWDFQADKLYRVSWIREETKSFTSQPMTRHAAERLCRLVRKGGIEAIIITLYGGVL